MPTQSMLSRTTRRQTRSSFLPFLLPRQAQLERHVTALEVERNAQQRTITRSFTASDARTKLRRLYPIPQR